MAPLLRLWPLMALLLSPAQALSPTDFAVYGFSQCDVEGEDPQVYELLPDITIRAIGKWSTNGTEASDYNFAQISRYHASNITFMGSGTASVIFPQDFPTPAIFDDMSTRDADGNIVPHDEFGFPIPARRGNLFNPAYRAYLLSWAKIQVDGGVDGINFDEVNGGFSGGQKHGFNGNEGFDDYALSDFNQYLLAKYPSFGEAEWTARFNLSTTNMLNRSLPATDLTRNFNYRTYLAVHAWNRSPHDAANPLASEWGKPTSNRLYADDDSFTATYTRRCWLELVMAVREYTRQTRNHTMLISSNGLWPYVDFNSIGMYPWNPDPSSSSSPRGADYVPVTATGRLNGSASLLSEFSYLKAQSARIAGPDVPVAVFIDWPNDMMAAYARLDAEQKKDYWRVFGADAYAAGVFPALHLRDTVGGITAAGAGVLEFMKGYAAFFRTNRVVFTSNEPVAGGVVGFGTTRRLVGSLLKQRGTGRRTVHVVNHNYDESITPVDRVVIEVVVAACPRGVQLISPDLPLKAIMLVKYECVGAKLIIYMGKVVYYNVLLLTD